MRGPLLISLTAALLAAPWLSSRAAEEVAIYRCIDAGGRVTLQDKPCPTGAKQQKLGMVRPQDPPPTLAPAAAAPTPAPATAPAYAASAPGVPLRIARDPEPLYECVRDDGSTYLSRTGIPERRYVALPLYAPGGGGVEPGQPVAYPYTAYATVDDNCYRLPQADVCERLIEERDRLRTRFFNAQQRERERIDREERALNERLRYDC